MRSTLRRPVRLAAAAAGLALAACDAVPTSSPTDAEAPNAQLSGGTETRLTDNPYLQAAPVIDGDLVVWVDLRNGNKDLYARDLATGLERPITTGAQVQQSARIDGSLIAYENWGSTLEIRVHDAATGADRQVTPSLVPGSESQPDVSGQRVVYVSNRGNSADIFLYDLQSNTETGIRTDRSDSQRPAVSGDWVVWQESTGGGDDPDIVLYHVPTGATKVLTDSGSWQGNPDVDGRIVVWEDNRDGNAEIYMHDIHANVTRRITSNPARQRSPRVQGNLIVWEDLRHGDGNVEVYAHDLATGQEFRVTTARGNQAIPAVSNGRIVWQDGRTYNTDVWMYTAPSGIQAARRR